MYKAVIEFGDNEIEKHKFHYQKNPISIDGIDLIKYRYPARFCLVKRVLNILLNTKIAKKLLYIIPPKMSGYTQSFNETKYMSFLIRDDKLLEKYNKIWDKVSNSIKKVFDSEPVSNNNYLKAKVKSHESTIAFDYQSVILIDSAFKIGETYHP